MTSTLRAIKLSAATHAVGNALRAMCDAWVACESNDRHGHPTEIEGYPFEGSLDDVTTDVYRFSSAIAGWAAGVERRRATDEREALETVMTKAELIEALAEFDDAAPIVLAHHHGSHSSLESASLVTPNGPAIQISTASMNAEIERAAREDSR